MAWRAIHEGGTCTARGSPAGAAGPHLHPLRTYTFTHAPRIGLFHLLHGHAGSGGTCLGSALDDVEKGPLLVHLIQSHLMNAFGYFSQIHHQLLEKYDKQFSFRKLPYFFFINIVNDLMKKLELVCNVAIQKYYSYYHIPIATFKSKISLYMRLISSHSSLFFFCLA